jgi:hypothetical protein
VRRTESRVVQPQFGKHFATLEVKVLDDEFAFRLPGNTGAGLSLVWPEIEAGMAARTTAKTKVRRLAIFTVDIFPL